MTDTILNDNQRRHVATALHLLELDVQRLRRRRGLTPELQSALHEVSRRARRLLDEFSLPPARPLSAPREVLAVASVWVVRVDDLRARRLRAYGPVAPGLEERLHPLIDELSGSLKNLMAVADRVTGYGDRTAED